MRKTYHVWAADNYSDDEPGYAVLAFDAGTAAELWAEHDDCNSADYTIVGGGDATVRVRAEDGSEPERWFTVLGETVARYHAHEVQPAVSALAALTERKSDAHK